MLIIPDRNESLVVPERKEENIFMTKSQFREIYEKQKKQSLGRRAWNVVKAMPEGAYSYFSEAWSEALADESLVKGLFNFFDDEEQKKAGSAVGGAFELGTRDLYRMGKSIFQNVKDEFSDLTEEEKFERDFRRLNENIAYNELVRPALAKSYADGKYQGDIKALADFLDPTIVIPGGFAPKVATKVARKTIKAGGKVVQGGAKVTEVAGKIVEKSAGLPRKVSQKLGISEGTYRLGYAVGTYSSYATGTPYGLLTPGLRVAETIGKVASKAGREVKEVARVFSMPSGHERFLFRLSTDQKVSKKTRKLATKLYKMQGDKAYDILFDGLVGGLSASAVQGALQFASGASDEQIGQAMGVGAGLGSPLGMLGGSRGSGKDLGSLNQDGSLTSRSEQSIKNYMSRKADKDSVEAMKELKKISPASAVLFATLDQASETADVRINILGNDEMKSVIDAGLPEGESVSKSSVPPAMYNENTRSIFINRDKIKEGVKEATHTIAHEIGHDHVVRMIGTDPQMRRVLLDAFVDEENGKEFFFYDNEGNKLGDPIKLNKQAQEFAEAYAKRIEGASASQAKRIRQDAGLLAEEMSADAFGLLFGDDPNVFGLFRPQIRQHFLNGAKTVLAHFGIVNKDTGEKTATNAINRDALKNGSLQNLFKNYLKGQRDHLFDRANELENDKPGKSTRTIQPKEGQSDADRFKEVFGGIGVDVNRAGQFTVPDEQAFLELKQLLKEIELEGDKNFATLGKLGGAPMLHPRIKAFFAKHAPDKRSAEIVIEMAEQMILSRDQGTYGFRSANNKPNKTKGYSPFEFRNAVFERFEISPKVFNANKKDGSQSIPHLKLIGYDQDKLLHNIEVLAQNGFLKEYGYSSTKDFLKAFEKESLRTAGKFDKEGARINPQGRAENELMTASFGNITSKFSEIKNPRLKDFLQDPDNKKLIQTTMITKGLYLFTGMSNTGKKGLAFKYENVRDNYMPKASATNNSDNVFMPKAFHGSPFTFSKFSTKNIGTGEGAQAFGYGLYFADKKEVASWYREKLSDLMDSKSIKYDGESFDPTDIRHVSAQRLQRDMKANAHLRNRIDNFEERIRNNVVTELSDRLKKSQKISPEDRNQIEGMITTLKNKNEAQGDQGKLYNVNIAPDKKEFLNWDKALPRDQLKKILKQSVKERFVSSAYAGLRGINEGIGQDATGREFYNGISEQLGSQQKASAFLERAGIPGVIYKDAFSRDSSSPGISDNYVVFDDKNVDIESVQFKFMPKKDDGETFARPLEEILERIPAKDRFKGERVPGQSIKAPGGGKFLSLNLDKPIGKLNVTQKDTDYAFADAIEKSGSSAQLAIERMAEKGHIMSPPNEAHFKDVEKLPLRDRFWYEISSEAMDISFPDFGIEEKSMTMDMTSATSPLADPNYNASLMLSIMSEYVRKVASYTPAVVQKAVSDVFFGVFGKEEARKVGSFGQTFKFLAGYFENPPLTTNDRQVATSFGIPDDMFGKYPVLYEVVSRYFNNIRDVINTKRGDHPDGVFEAYQVQAPSWVQTRAEGKQTKNKNLTEEEIFEGDAYANAFKLIADRLRKAGIKVGKDKETGLPLFTRKVLEDPRITEILSPLALDFRDSKFGTMEIVTLLHESGRKFADLLNKSRSMGITLNIKSAEKVIQSGMKKLMNRTNIRDAKGKVVKTLPSTLSRLQMAMTGKKGASGEITRIEIGKGTFEGAMSPNIRIPMDGLPPDMHETFLAVLGDAYMQEAQAGSVFNATNDTPDTYSVFINGLKVDNEAMQPFSEHLSSIGHEANISQRPNGVVIDVNPKFNDDFTTSPIDFEQLDKLISDTFSDYDSKIYGQTYDSTYIERSDYGKAINNFKNRKRNEFSKQIREATGVKASVATDILRGGNPEELQALKVGERKRVERIKSAYDSFLRDIKSVSKDIRASAKSFEKATKDINPKLEKRIEAETKRRVKLGNRLTQATRKLKSQNKYFEDNLLFSP